MNICFTGQGWDDYLYWQKTDKKILKKINELIRDVQRTPYEGLGKPEALKHTLAGFWSRRIDREHRLVYEIAGERIVIIQCRFHY